MEKNRRGKTQRVNAIQDSAVSFDHSAEVLNPDVRLIALITRPPQNPKMQMVNDIPADCSGVKGVAHQSAAPSAVALKTRRKTLPRFCWDSRARRFVPPEQFAPHKLQDVAHLIHDHQIEQQPRILPFVAWNLQQQQCGAWLRQYAHTMIPN